MGMLRDGLLARAGGNPKAEMPFLDHLEELRWRILWILAAVIAGCLAGLAIVVYGDVVGYLMEPGRALFGDDWKAQYPRSHRTTFFILLKISLTIGIILAFPIIVYHIVVVPRSRAGEAREAGHCSISLPGIRAVHRGGGDGVRTSRCRSRSVS